jgi:hypothetical protein
MAGSIEGVVSALSAIRKVDGTSGVAARLGYGALKPTSTEYWRSGREHSLLESLLAVILPAFNLTGEGARTVTEISVSGVFEPGAAD